MLENRDYTLIIDKSASMSTQDQKNGTSRWVALQESTFALATKCEEFDLDGITIYVFAKEFKRYDHVTSAKVKQIFTENIPGDTTNLAGVLQDAINNYLQRKANSQTKPAGEVILVVTDGTQGDRKAVYEIIINATQHLDNPQELRIYLIQVGADTKAAKFLHALDDGLQSVGAKFDICDTITLEELEEMSLTDVLIKAITG
ncbi:VWA domain-containing protein [Nostoc sp. UCD121]|uniref:vWA domain-containing protein n=1 Tax=unclassified Nostoc TaxID=2593658 RepID=UPI001623E3F9|nr:MULTISPECIES: VWA domain-containing protein [unclassified Nostoc]MBC1224901.1 VWA domain-containing protein [Nostoc sp. UCD120]MBC1277978.1 VWA domain-containing protein [Nostoc sp. UCD121]MBC1294909.1 VWA domain-containing protein [Nostoc sp. UCD122]